MASTRTSEDVRVRQRTVPGLGRGTRRVHGRVAVRSTGADSGRDLVEMEEPKVLDRNRINDSRPDVHSKEDESPARSSRPNSMVRPEEPVLVGSWDQEEVRPDLCLSLRTSVGFHGFPDLWGRPPWGEPDLPPVGVIVTNSWIHPLPVRFSWRPGRSRWPPSSPHGLRGSTMSGPKNRSSTRWPGPVGTLTPTPRSTASDSAACRMLRDDFHSTER